MSLATTPVLDREAILREWGFASCDGCWRRDQVLFRMENSWLRFETAWAPGADPLRDHLGKPGLWKPVCEGDSRRLIFAVPQAIVRENETSEVLDECSLFECVIDWALGTVEGNLLNQARGDAYPPIERQTVESYLPKAGLTISHRSYTRQTELICEPKQLVLRTEILPCVAPELPEQRLRWLRALLLEAQDRYRFVRLGLPERPLTGTLALPQTTVAEVDLTGIPAALLEPMLSMSLDALQWVVSWLIESADFIGSPGMASRVLEICAVPETNP